MNQFEPLSLSHLDESGQVRMVDVGAKLATQRVAVCGARVRMGAPAFRLLEGHERGKGEVLNTARVAGVLAAKRCAELIPLCHTLPLSFVGIDFSLDPDHHVIEITATCRSEYKTGVEMEAMTACSVAALTVYDMCKAADKGIVIEDVRLLYKAGGKSGEWRAPGAEHAAGARLASESGAGFAGDTESAKATGAGESAADGAKVAGVQAPGGDSKPFAKAASQAPSNGKGQGSGAVQVVYFARVAELAGVRNEVLNDVAPLTGTALLERLEARYPQLAPVARLKLAVNQRHALHDVSIQPGDEVAVFEPVTGG